MPAVSFLSNQPKVKIIIDILKRVFVIFIIKKKKNCVFIFNERLTRTETRIIRIR